MTTKFWWMIGGSDEVPHFHYANSAGHALAVCLVERVDQKVRDGVRRPKAQEAVRKLNLHILRGSMDPHEAYSLHIGWVWSAAAAIKEGNETPTQPLTRDDAVQRLGEEKVQQLQNVLADKYKIARHPKERTGPSRRKTSFMQDAALVDEVVELHVRDKKNPREISEHFKSRGVEISYDSVRKMLERRGVFSPQHNTKRIEIPNLKRIGARYANGETLVALAKELGISQGVLARRLTEAGYKTGS